MVLGHADGYPSQLAHLRDAATDYLKRGGSRAGHEFALGVLSRAKPPLPRLPETSATGQIAPRVRKEAIGHTQSCNVLALLSVIVPGAIQIGAALTLPLGAERVRTTA